jgi:hypothetical protein
MNENDDDVAHRGILPKPQNFRNMARFGNSPPTAFAQFEREMIRERVVARGKEARHAVWQADRRGACGVPA